MLFKDGEISTSDSCLFNFIAPNIKVLFVKPRGYKGLKYLIERKNIDAYILDKRYEMEDYVQQIGGSFIKGDLYNACFNIPNGTFDLVVMDDILLSYLNLELIFEYAIRLGRYCLITMTNKSKLSDRMRFLLSGRITEQFSSELWFRRNTIHTCTPKEFFELCSYFGVSLERACFYDTSMNVKSVYDITSMPGLFANKFYFFIKTKNQL